MISWLMATDRKEDIRTSARRLSSGAKRRRRD